MFYCSLTNQQKELCIVSVSALVTQVDISFTLVELPKYWVSITPHFQRSDPTSQLKLYLRAVQNSFRYPKQYSDDSTTCKQSQFSSSLQWKSPYCLCLIRLAQSSTFRIESCPALTNSILFPLSCCSCPHQRNIQTNRTSCLVVTLSVNH